MAYDNKSLIVLMVLLKKMNEEKSYICFTDQQTISQQKITGHRRCVYVYTLKRYTVNTIDT